MDENFRLVNEIYNTVYDDSILKEIKTQTKLLHNLLKKEGENVRNNEMNITIRYTLSIVKNKYISLLEGGNHKEAEILENFMKTYYGFTKISKSKTDFDFDENKLRKISENLMLIYMHQESLLRGLIKTSKDANNSFQTQINADSIQSEINTYYGVYLIPTMLAHEYLEEILGN